MKKLVLILGLFGLSMPLMAACNPDNNGGTCNDGGNVGPQGVTGPQGVVGPQGPVGPAADTHAKLVVDGAIRLYDGRYAELQAFDMYELSRHESDHTVAQGGNFVFGARVVLKPWKSHEERLLDKQAAQIKALEAQLSRLMQ